MKDDSIGGRSLGSTIMSVVLGAADVDPANRREQMERFIHQYGAPLKAHLVFRRHLTREAADDLLHDFIMDKLLQPDPHRNLAWRFLEKKREQQSLRFRGYLVRSLNNYVAERKRKNSPVKSGLDEMEYAAPSTPPAEDAFDVDWAHHLLNQALESVRRECREKNQDQVWRIFEIRVVRPARTGTPPPSYDEVVRESGCESPKEASNRLQTAIRKFNRIIRELVAEYLPSHAGTVAEAEIEEELRDLRQVLGGQAGLQIAASQQSAISSVTDSLCTVSANLFAVPEDADALWKNEDDLAAIWQHLVAMRLDDFLREAQPALADKYSELTIYDGAPLETVHDVFRHPRPPLDVLQAMKREAKANALRQAQTQGWAENEPASNGLPTCINAVLYTIAIATAWVRLGTRITRDENRRFVRRLEFVLSLAWIDRVSRHPVRLWLEEIRREEL